MKICLIALAVAGLSIGAYADTNNDGTFMVQNPHGGYNTIQAGGPPAALPFLGIHGYAASVAAHGHEKKKFVLYPFLEDDGHGNKHTVYKKVYFWTAEDAATAQANVNSGAPR